MKIPIILLPAIATSVMAHAHDGVFGGLSERHALRQLAARQNGPPYPSGPGFDVPPLTAITAIPEGGPAAPTVALPTPPAPGATAFPGAPPLPPVAINIADFPPYGAHPDVNSPQVRQWMTELEGKTIPPWSPTLNASCQIDVQAAAEAGPNARCWWTCGGCTRPEDITTCTDKMDWGLTFDDGPSPYTPKLLHYLDSLGLKATFYLVGSNVIARPEMVQAEHLGGHELSVHTWSHRAGLTTMSNELIVAELGWTREAIRQVTGVTPLTMRPPFGDIDDRVRAISLAMGLVPVMWTRLEPNGVEVLFDSNDWRVHGGGINSTAAKAQLDAALDLAQGLDTGVVVLQHDLYQESVDLAIGSTIPDGRARNPPFSMKPVISCLKQPLGNAYKETTTNSSNPAVTGRPSGTGTATRPPSGTGTQTSTTGRPGGAVRQLATGAGAALIAVGAAAVLAF